MTVIKGACSFGFGLNILRCQLEATTAISVQFNICIEVKSREIYGEIYGEFLFSSYLRDIPDLKSFNVSYAVQAFILRTKISHLALQNMQGLKISSTSVKVGAVNKKKYLNVSPEATFHACSGSI